jgi:hypothetical protein
MRILFCDNFIDRTIDPDFQDEHDTALRRGFQVDLISYEDVKASKIARSISRLKTHPEIETAIYRGWMIPLDKYFLLYEALLAKNIKLINSPQEYKNCHYLPECYKWIKDFTPKTNWTPLTGEADFDKIFQLTAEFKNRPIILKDYVKSQKHNWREACYIPDASDQERVKSVVLKFIELQVKDLNVGLVFRRFEELEFLTKHHKSGMALTKEFRLFFLRGRLIQVLQYWDEGDYGEAKPDLELFSEIGQRIDSNFFTMDIAKKKDGEWMIIELGDGQVSGLPENANKDSFYESLGIEGLDH